MYVQKLENCYVSVQASKTTLKLLVYVHPLTLPANATLVEDLPNEIFSPGVRSREVSLFPHEILPDTLQSREDKETGLSVFTFQEA